MKLNVVKIRKVVVGRQVLRRVPTAPVVVAPVRETERVRSRHCAVARNVKGVVVVQRVFVDAPVYFAQQLHVGEDFEVGVLVNVRESDETAMVLHCRVVGRVCSR